MITNKTSILISTERRWLQNEELHSLYRSPNIVRVIRSTRLTWAGHVATMQEGRTAFKILTCKIKKKKKKKQYEIITKLI